MTGPEFIPTTVFRETPSVSFYDATISDSNGCDVVCHESEGVSPPYDEEFPTFYVHEHQVDRNLCVHGSRVFYLAHKMWPEPYHKIYITPQTGSLVIPVGCFHRSESGPDGSVLINQPIRSEFFDVNTEFVPVSARDDEWLRTTIQQPPVVWKDGRRVGT